MLLQDIYSRYSTGIEAVPSSWTRKKSEENTTAAPGTGFPGTDTVSISEEAKAAYQAAAAQGGNSGQGAVAANEETGKEPTAADQFSAYMRKTRSKAQAANPEEQIKRLQEQLNGLQGTLMQLTSSSRAGSDKSGQIENLQSQIRSITEQIAELSSQLPENEDDTGQQPA